MAEFKIKLSVNSNITNVDLFNITTGEYFQRLGYINIVDDWSECDKVFVVFSYDKKEYESEVTFDVNEEGTPLQTGSFDIPVFDKPGYINVGAYGYKYVEVTEISGEKKKVLERIYSPQMDLGEIKNGSKPIKPVPSPNTYEKLNRRIEELGTGIRDTEEMRNWWYNFVQNQEVLNLREVFNTIDETGSFVASYKNIYDIIEDYFGEGQTIGRPAGDKLFEISYFKINLTLSNNTWTADKTYIQIKDAIKEGKLPIIHYVTNEDDNYAIYSNHSDDGIVFSETKTIVQEGSTERQIKLINFTINEFDVVTKEEVIVNDIIASQFEKVENKQNAIDETRKSPLYYATENAIVTYVLSKIPDVSIYELKANKKDVIDSESTDSYPNFKAVKGYAEALANRVTSLLNADDNHYPTAKAVTDYAEPKANKKDVVNQSNTEFPTSQAVINYAENKANKDNQMVTPDNAHYPTTLAVKNFGDANYTYRFDSGKLIRTTEGEGKDPIGPVNEVVCKIPASFQGKIKCKLSHDFISTQPNYPTITQAIPGVTIPAGQSFESGEFYIEVGTGIGQETSVTVSYYYYDKHYEYKLHFYRGENPVPESIIAPIDLTQLRGGGGGGSGGISFDEVKVEPDNSGTQILNFYYMGTKLSVEDSSLAPVQLASIDTTGTSTTGATRVVLKNKESTPVALAEFDLDSPLSTEQMTALKSLI